MREEVVKGSRGKKKGGGSRKALIQIRSPLYMISALPVSSVERWSLTCKPASSLSFRRVDYVSDRIKHNNT
jgi:hypothetical protein